MELRPAGQIRDNDSAGLAEQIERPLNFHARLVIGSGWFLLLGERQRRIGSERRLLAQSACHVDLRA